MGKIMQLTGSNGSRIGIPVNKITGITETPKAQNECYGKTFIATGADDPDGGENGWYVQESYGEVFIMLETILKNNTPPIKEEL